MARSDRGRPRAFFVTGTLAAFFVTGRGAVFFVTGTGLATGALTSVNRIMSVRRHLVARPASFSDGNEEISELIIGEAVEDGSANVHLGRHDLANERQEGARVGVSLSDQVREAASAFERAADHLADVASDVVERPFGPTHAGCGRLSAFSHNQSLFCWAWLLTGVA
jgi:hypothetical protein